MLVLGKGNARAQGLLECVLYHQMRVRVGINTHFDPNQAAFSSALRAACLQQGRWVVEQPFGSVMSKSEDAAGLF